MLRLIFTNMRISICIINTMHTKVDVEPVLQLLHYHAEKVSHHTTSGGCIPYKIAMTALKGTICNFSR